MADKPIDLEAIRKADARLKQLLEDHPDLREPNPERQEALEAWLEDHLQEQEAMEKKPGRPDKYHSDTERPVNVSLRIPRDLYEQVERYRRMHSLTLTELLLDGLRLRLETPADPRDIILSDDNTVMQELQEMIQTAVQAEIGKLRDFIGPHVSIPGLIATPEAPAEPVPEVSHDNNTVLQESVRQTIIPPYDETKYVLGKLCPQRHEWGTTGQSLLSIHGHTCKECKNEYKRRKRAEKRQGQPA